MKWRSAAGYFAAPFPSRKGFAAYRMPGPVFHLSVFALGVVIGLALCIPGNALDTVPLLAVWVIAWFYFGRDLAIHAHYNGLLVVIWFVGVVSIFIFPKLLGSLFRTLAAFSNAYYPEAAVAATAAVAVGFAFWMRWTIRDLFGESQ